MWFGRLKTYRRSALREDLDQNILRGHSKKKQTLGRDIKYGILATRVYKYAFQEFLFLFIFNLKTAL